MMTESLQNKARQHRKDILKMLCGCQSGHPGGSLSVVEIIMALYEHVLRYDAKNPLWAQRDRMVLSKGHGCPALYAVLADKGFFPRETLWTLRQMGTVLQGHPDMLKTPGVDASTGSLGQGMSIPWGSHWRDNGRPSLSAFFVLLGMAKRRKVWYGRPRWQRHITVLIT